MLKFLGETKFNREASSVTIVVEVCLSLLITISIINF